MYSDSVNDYGDQIRTAGDDFNDAPLIREIDPDFERLLDEEESIALKVPKPPIYVNEIRLTKAEQQDLFNVLVGRHYDIEHEIGKIRRGIGNAVYQTSNIAALDSQLKDLHKLMRLVYFDKADGFIRAYREMEYIVHG